MASGSIPGESTLAWSAAATRFWATPSTTAMLAPTGCWKPRCAARPRERIYEITGLQFLPFNTIYQLLALATSHSPLLEVTETLLLMPDLFGWLLTGRRVGERTNASTTQLLDPRSGMWSDELCAALELPRAILPELIEAGSTLGPIRPSVADELGLARSIDVIVPATHDTASAVAAVPVVSVPARSQSAAAPDWCYLSSGTWSLLGVEVSQPVINSETMRYNFTNEGGRGGDDASAQEHHGPLAGAGVPPDSGPAPGASCPTSC